MQEPRWTRHGRTRRNACKNQQWMRQFFASFIFALFRVCLFVFAIAFSFALPSFLTCLLHLCSAGSLCRSLRRLSLCCLLHLGLLNWRSGPVQGPPGTVPDSPTKVTHTRGNLHPRQPTLTNRTSKTNFTISTTKHNSKRRVTLILSQSNKARQQGEVSTKHDSKIKHKTMKRQSTMMRHGRRTMGGDATTWKCDDMERCAMTLLPLSA